MWTDIHVEESAGESYAYAYEWNILLCYALHKVSYLEIALCSMQGMIWEDTDALFVGIYTLLSWIYFHMNRLIINPK